MESGVVGCTKIALLFNVSTILSPIVHRVFEYTLYHGTMYCSIPSID